MGEGRCDRCYQWHERKFEGLFGMLGTFISRHPVKILIIFIAVNCLLMLGLINLRVENDVEVLYTPQNSQSSLDRAEMRTLFPDPTNSNFRSYQLADFGQYGDILILSKNNSNIMSQPYVNEINTIDSYIRNSILASKGNGGVYTYQQLCALDSSGCHVFGSVVLTSPFQQNFALSNMTFPYFNQELLSPVLAQAKYQSGMLQSTTGVRLRYYLQQNTSTYSTLWEEEFVNQMQIYHTNLTDIAVAHSNSLNKELDKNTGSDIKFFSVTFTLMITFAYLALTSLNCNNVANRMNLATPGVLAAVLGIASAFGFVSGTGVAFTNIVGVMPFLVVGIGIDDMFILMSGLADAPPLPEHSIAERIQFMMKKSGIAITITSLTDFLAFVIGASSVFISIRNFCLYTGVAVFFCYLNQIFLLSPAIVINEKRTQQRRHYCVCCLKSKPNDKLEKEGRSKWYIRCFGGDYPKKREDFESPLERYPKMIVGKILTSIVGRAVIFICILGYLATSIYGIVNLKQGLLLYNLVSEDSYYHTFSVWEENYFTTEPIITLCITQKQTYSSSSTQNLISSVLSNAKQDWLVDDIFEVNWLTSYKSSAFYNETSEAAFINGLNQFLTLATNFKNDVVIDASNTKIISSKMYVKAVNVKSTTDQGNLMLRMRTVSTESSLPCFFYSPAFIFFEQYVQILPSTLQTVGIAVAVMLVITLIFMPKPVLVLVVAVTLVSILVGIFGFMHYWNLTLSSITMIHLVMSVGFSVDFSVHICHAFLAVEGNDKSVILHKALNRSGGPVFNAAFSSLLGIAMLGLSTSYIFLSFGKLMFLVIAFGLIHAAFFIPVILYLLIPCYKNVGISGEHENRVGTCLPDTDGNLNSSNNHTSHDSNGIRNPGRFQSINYGFTMYTNTSGDRQKNNDNPK